MDSQGATHKGAYKPNLYRAVHSNLDRDDDHIACEKQAKGSTKLSRLRLAVLQLRAGDHIKGKPIAESQILVRLVEEPALGHPCPRCGVGRGSYCRFVSGDRHDTAKPNVHQERRLTFLADYIGSWQAGVAPTAQQASGESTSDDAIRREASR